MTERLYYDQPNLFTFEATVVEVSADKLRVYLDRTAFYPTSGGQPHDVGLLGPAPVSDVTEDEDGRIAHHLGEAWTGAVGETVSGSIDEARRIDHRVQHTAQHLLSAVLAERYGMQTRSFHLGEEVSTIDVDAAGGTLDEARLDEIEKEAAIEIRVGRPVRVSYVEAGEAEGLRKASERSGVLRIVEIEGLDKSACGGTHVSTTGEIGQLSIRRVEKMRGLLRIEFLAGERARRRARLDYEAIAGIARSLTVSVDQAPAQIASMRERLEQSEKAMRKMVIEEAERRGRELYAATEVDARGRRVIEREFASLGDEARRECQAFVGAGDGAVYLATGENPPALLLAAGSGAGIDAAALLKPVLAEVGGKGGGTAGQAQGSLPGVEELRRARTRIRELLVGPPR